MVRENMRSPRAELMTTLVRPIFTRTRKKLQGLVSGFDSRLATGFGSWGISSNGRAVASHATGKGIDAPILHRTVFVKAWLAQSVERTTLNRRSLTTVPRKVIVWSRVQAPHRVQGFRFPFLGRVWGGEARTGRKAEGFTTMDGTIEHTNECPADPGSSPGEGDVGEKRARRHVSSRRHIPSCSVPRSLGGQDSRFSLRLCSTRFVVVFPSRPSPPASPSNPSLSFRKEAPLPFNGLLTPLGSTPSLRRHACMV